MEYRQLGQTDLRPSVLSMGCLRLAAITRDAREAEATLHEAFEHGISFFDTADSYQLGGSERLLGKAFKDKRDRVLICSKSGDTANLEKRVRAKIGPLANWLHKHSSFVRDLASARQSRIHWVQPEYAEHLPDVPTPYKDFRPDYIEQAITRSLGRLQTDYLDLFLLHSPPVSALSEDALFERLDRLRERGMIRYYGVSLRPRVSAPMLDLCFAHSGVAALQLEADPYHSSVIDQVEKRMSNNSVGLIARAPLGRGTLFRDQRDLNALSGSVAATPAQAAIRLAMQLNPRGTVLVGMTNRKHLRENLGALDLPAYSDRSLAILKSWQNDEVAEEVPNGPVKPI